MSHVGWMDRQTHRQTHTLPEARGCWRSKWRLPEAARGQNIIPPCTNLHRTILHHPERMVQERRKEKGERRKKKKEKERKKGIEVLR